MYMFRPTVPSILPEPVAAGNFVNCGGKVYKRYSNLIQSSDSYIHCTIAADANFS